VFKVTVAAGPAAAGNLAGGEKELEADAHAKSNAHGHGSTGKFNGGANREGHNQGKITQSGSTIKFLINEMIRLLMSEVIQL
jgi:hypothetical protein